MVGVSQGVCYTVYIMVASNVIVLYTNEIYICGLQTWYCNCIYSPTHSNIVID